MLADHTPQLNYHLYSAEIHVIHLPRVETQRII